MRSVMTHAFSQVPKVNVERSNFDRRCGIKTTFDAGYLIPVFLDEVVPGDTFNLHMSCFARLATPLKPVMDNMRLSSFFFFVPLRLIWANFTKFMGEKETTDVTTYLTPQITCPGGGGAAVGSLWDYFGLPIGVNSLTVNSFWHRAYNLIWNTWFRDENLQASVVVDTDDGPDTYGDYVLLRRGKRHDYFTSCLKWPQKGDDVLLPLGSIAPVVSDGNTIRLSSAGATDAKLNLSNTAPYISTGTPHPGAGEEAHFGSVTGLQADLSGATASTINALREAFQLQKYYEKDARGGTRYTEKIRAHFGVVSPDARLQRPEYLGGGVSDVNIHPVPQTSVAAATPQGNLAAFGTVSGSGHGFVKSFTEHGVILGLVSVQADLTYQNGIPRMFSRRTDLDFYWPEFAHLGEQAVLNKEIYAQGTADDNLAFGYQERYAEMRYKPSLITGLFRSAAAGTLEVWHLAQKYVGLPVLGATFIEDNPPIDRVIAVPSEPHFIFDAFFDLKCARPMPVYGVPGLIDHF